MRKVVYIIPEYMGSPSDSAYRKVGTIFQSIGIKPIGISITWKRRTMTQYVNEFMEKYNKIKKRNEEVYLFGFSYGANVAFIAATQIKPKAVIMGSLSPFFKEDLKYAYKSWLRGVGKTRVADHRNQSFNSFAKKFKSRALIFVGEKEWEQCHRRARIAHKLIKNSKLIVVPSARHKLQQKEYQAAVKKYVTAEFTHSRA